MHTLADKVAIITGASSGIGYAAARLFARHGARLIVSGRRQPALAALVEEIEAEGGEAVAIAGDVRDEILARDLVDAATGRFGGLDIAFNNAGSTGESGETHELSAGDWSDTIDTNLTAAFLGAKYQLPAMLERGGGSLLFTSSFVGVTVGMPGMAAYAASKAGQLGLVRTLAVEYGGRGIRANAILPGGTETPSNTANARGAGPEVRAFVEGLHALKRMARPDEIAQTALFLASEAASFVTGTAMFVDGGVSISRT